MNKSLNTTTEQYYPRRPLPIEIKQLTPQLIEAYQQCLITALTIENNFASSILEKKEVFDFFCSLLNKQIESINNNLSDHYVKNNKEFSEKVLFLVKKNLNLLKSVNVADFDIANIQLKDNQAQLERFFKTNLEEQYKFDQLDHNHLPPKNDQNRNSIIDIVFKDLGDHLFFNYPHANQLINLSYMQNCLAGAAISDQKHLNQETLGSVYPLIKQVAEKLNEINSKDSKIDDIKKLNKQENNLVSTIAQLCNDDQYLYKEILRVNLLYNPKYKKDFFVRYSNKVSKLFSFVLTGLKSLFKIAPQQAKQILSSPENNTFLKFHPEKFERVEKLQKNIDLYLEKHQDNILLTASLNNIKNQLLPKMINLYENVADQAIIQEKTKKEAEEFFNQSMLVFEQEIIELDLQNEKNITKKLNQFRDFLQASVKNDQTLS